MLLICLTGGIASGKSTVAQVFKDMGAIVEHADELARSLMSSKPAIRAALTRTLGRSFFTESGELLSSDLAEFIFNHPEARKNVNMVVHPHVYEVLEQRFEDVQAEDGCFIVETALAIETGFADRFDEVIMVSSPDSERIHRLVELQGFSHDQARARISAQLPQESMIERADHVIENSGNLKELEEKARTLYKKLCGNE